MLDRRGFLQLFGVGAAVVPLVGGLPKMEAAGKLIEIPKLTVEPVSKMPSESMLELLGHELVRLQVNFTLKGGKTVSLQANSFVTEQSFRSVDVTSCESPFVHRIPGPRRIEWNLKGVLSDEPVTVIG
jgi:hypothetical protein